MVDLLTWTVVTDSLLFTDIFTWMTAGLRPEYNLYVPHTLQCLVKYSLVQGLVEKEWEQFQAVELYIKQAVNCLTRSSSIQISCLYCAAFYD